MRPTKWRRPFSARSYATRIGQEGFSLVCPIRVLPNRAKVVIFHPIRKDIAEAIQSQVSKAYQKLLMKVGEERRRMGAANE